MHFELSHKEEWSYLSNPELEEAGIIHGFFTKASPVLPLTPGDRKRFLLAFGLKDLVIMDQEHGTCCHIVKDGERPAAGDGIVMLEKGIAGIIKTADCLPVIICDPLIPIAAIVHAGWRGTVKGITTEALRILKDLGASPKNMTALLGPCISACCYEVKEDVHGAFMEAGFSKRIFEQSGGSLYLDLRMAQRELLEREGVETILDSAVCTCCNPRTFVSFRRGDAGHRQLSFVALRDKREMEQW